MRKITFFNVFWAPNLTQAACRTGSLVWYNSTSTTDYCDELLQHAQVGRWTQICTTCTTSIESFLEFRNKKSQFF